MNDCRLILDCKMINKLHCITQIFLTFQNSKAFNWYNVNISSKNLSSGDHKKEYSESKEKSQQQKGKKLSKINKNIKFLLNFYEVDNCMYFTMFHIPLTSVCCCAFCDCHAMIRYIYFLKLIDCSEQTHHRGRWEIWGCIWKKMWKKFLFDESRFTYRSLFTLFHSLKLRTIK